MDLLALLRRAALCPRVFMDVVVYASDLWKRRPAGEQTSTRWLSGPARKPSKRSSRFGTNWMF